MAVFDWVESASTQLEEEPRIKSTRFGDGYEQRWSDGLNPIAQRWSVRFSEAENASADAIVQFFRDRGGVEPFDWTPLWHTASRRFVCRRWSRAQPDEWGFSDISAEFEQVFEP